MGSEDGAASGVARLSKADAFRRVAPILAIGLRRLEERERATGPDRSGNAMLSP